MTEVLLTIDDPHIEALVVEVAELRGLPVDAAMREALEWRLLRMAGPDNRQADRDA